MKFKKFVGRSFKEVMETIKQELGPDAIIVSHKKINSGPFGIMNKDAIEVTAAVDETTAAPPPRKFEASNISGAHEIMQELRSLRDELGFLKETLRPIVPTLRVGKDKKGLFNLLVRQGVDTHFAMILLERAKESIDSLKEVIGNDLKIEGLKQAEERGLVFLGPSGVGKTTTMAKVAQMLADKDKKVSLISLDEDRIGSIAEMKILSGRLKCPLKTIKKMSDLPKVVYKDIHRGPILIDTPGHSFKETLNDIKEIFPSGFPLKKCFLMDASINTDAALKAWKSCDSGSIDSIGFTKLDLATQYGGLYNLSLLTGRPLSLLTTGPDVPDAIRVPSAQFLAGLVIGGV